VYQNGSKKLPVCIQRGTGNAIPHGCRATALTDGNVLIRAAAIEVHGHVDYSTELDRRQFKDVKTTVGGTLLSHRQLTVSVTWSNYLY
jgi:hypothetical protein